MKPVRTFVKLPKRNWLDVHASVFEWARLQCRKKESRRVQFMRVFEDGSWDLEVWENMNMCGCAAGVDGGHLRQGMHGRVKLVPTIISGDCNDK